LVIFSVLFDELLALETGNIPYPAFAFSGMILWFYFTSLVNQCGNSVINAQELIKKTYFPKIILPIAKFLSATLELTVSLFLLLVLLILFEIPIKFSVLYIPAAILLIGTIGFSIGLWICVLSIKNRDMVQIVPYLTNYAIWITPVFYPTTIIPEQYRDIAYYLNPVAVSLDFFRSLIFNSSFDKTLLICAIPVGIFLLIGILYFKRKEGNFADFV
jgi:lipopolysaccharide transport system permease protein